MKNLTVFAALAMAFTGCVGTADQASSAENTLTLHDACTGEAIGVMDLDQDRYRFADGLEIEGASIVSLSPESVPAEIRQALESGTPEDGAATLCDWQPEVATPAAAGVLWANSHCWYMSEGGAGCKGCAYPQMVWEYCWDYMR